MLVMVGVSCNVIMDSGSGGQYPSAVETLVIKVFPPLLIDDLSFSQRIEDLPLDA